MHMYRLEKLLVNRQRKADSNMVKIRERLQEINCAHIHDVLELGCGMGTVAAFLANTYQMRVQGTDFDPEQIRLARQQHQEHDHLHFGVEDATALTFDDASFDLVVSQNALHHIPDWQQGLSEAARVLRPGGYFVWLDLVCPKILQGILRPLSGKVGLYSLEDVRTTLTAVGCVPYFHERCMHEPIVHHHMVWQKQGAERSLLT
jgi:ubiquinone/menaquinone biosynthesis C-methylase UbiE